MNFDIQAWFNAINTNAVVLAYQGTISSDLIEKILDSVEGRLVEINENNKLKRKVYNVLVEALQNLYHHIDTPEENDSTNEKFGVVSIVREGEGYRISTGNFVKKDRIKMLKDRLDQINYLSNEELKALYRMILDNQEFSDKGGGGLGMIDIARKAGNKLDYAFFKYNTEYSFFHLNVLV